MSRGSSLFALALALVACSSRPKPPPPAPPPLAADAYTHYLRGRIAALEGDDASAAREFERAALAAPEQPSIAVARIGALLGSRQRAAAEAAALDAVRRWPHDAEVQLAAGRVYRKLRRYPRAIAALSRARELARSDELAEDVALELGRVYVATEAPKQAMALYRQLIAERPALVVPRLRLLTLLVDARDHAAAAEVGKALVELRPAHVKARVLYSRALAGLGKRDEALATLREAFDRSGGRLEIGEQLFDALLDGGQRRSALALLELLSSGELDTGDRVKLGQLYIRIGHYARAEAIASAVLAGGASDDAVELRAAALAGLHRFEHAAETIEPLTGELWALSFAAEMLTHAGKADAAMARLEAAPANPGREVARSRVRELAGDLAGARRVLGEARERWPRERDLTYARAALELRAGEHRAAARLVESLRVADPDNLDLLNFLGYTLADGGIDLARAETLLARALRRAPDSSGILDSVGWLYFRRGRLGAAAAHLYRALRLAPVDAEILFHVAVLERALGREAAATRRLREARSRALEPTLRARIDAEMVRSGP